MDLHLIRFCRSHIMALAEQMARWIYLPDRYVSGIFFASRSVYLGHYSAHC